MLSIQVSLILWTVICFFLLLLILRNLLFKPMLACMDARRKKISDAEIKHRNDLDREKEAAALAETALMELTAKSEAEMNRKTERVRTEAEHTLAALIAREQSDCEAYRNTLEAERKAFENETETAAKQLGDLFVSDFIS